jgi:chromosome segregation ATPase
LKALETENKNLRALLKEAKSSLSQSGNTAPPAPPAASSGGDTKALENQLRKVQDELEAANARVAQFEATLNTKNSKISSLEEEVSRLRSAATNSATSGSETAKMLEAEIKKTKAEVS